mmetsp:Transcript_13278/g.26982  ORF Transcript_13278/g.26982 Transcript_13278/m.26982 type:complete len:131 (+) Transcript_13278:2981-3373(+)
MELIHREVLLEGVRLSAGVLNGHCKFSQQHPANAVVIPSLMSICFMVQESRRIRGSYRRLISKVHHLLRLCVVLIRIGSAVLYCPSNQTFPRESSISESHGNLCLIPSVWSDLERDCTTSGEPVTRSIIS